MKSLTPAQLSAWIADPARARAQLVDVRESWEFQICRVPDSLLVPLRELPARFAELDPDAETVVICHHGGRSIQAACFLERQGFARVHNLSGGVDAWARTVDPAMPVY